MKEFSVLKEKPDIRYWDLAEEKEMGAYCFSLCARGAETLAPRWRTIRMEEML